MKRGPQLIPWRVINVEHSERTSSILFSESSAPPVFISDDMSNGREEKRMTGSKDNEEMSQYEGSGTSD